MTDECLSRAYCTRTQSSPPSSDRNQPTPDTLCNRFGAGGSAQLVKDRADVELDCVLGDTETSRDILVDQSLSQHSKYVGFPGGNLFGQLIFNLQWLIAKDCGQAFCSRQAQQHQSIMDSKNGGENIVRLALARQNRPHPAPQQARDRPRVADFRKQNNRCFRGWLLE